jgi:hypothetical protein
MAQISQTGTGESAVLADTTLLELEKPGPNSQMRIDIAGQLCTSGSLLIMYVMTYKSYVNTMETFNKIARDIGHPRLQLSLHKEFFITVMVLLTMSILYSIIELARVPKHSMLGVEKERFNPSVGIIIPSVMNVILTSFTPHVLFHSMEHMVRDEKGGYWRETKIQTLQRVARQKKNPQADNILQEIDFILSRIRVDLYITTFFASLLLSVMNVVRVPYLSFPALAIVGVVPFNYFATRQDLKYP